MARKKTKNPNGSGSLFYNEKLKKWVGQVSAGRNEQGKVIRKTVYGKTQGEAIAKMQDVQNQISTGTLFSKDNITIYALAKQMEDYKLNLNNVKIATYQRNISTLKMLSPIYNMPIQSVTRSHLDNFFIEQTAHYSNSCIKKMYALVKRVFSEAEDRKIIIDNPMKKVQLPKSKKETKKVRALTINERKALYELLTTEDVQFSRQMLLSMFTGMRMGEINALNVSDIDLTFSNTIKVNKTVSLGENSKPIISSTAKTEAGTRTLRIENEIVKDLLRESIGTKRSGLLFTTDKGGIVSTNQVNHQFMRIKDKYGFIDDSVFGSVSIHSLRHTFATMSIEAGVDAKVLQKLLGHTDISITLNTYADVFAQFEETSLKRVSDYMNSTIFNKEAEKLSEQA